LAVSVLDDELSLVLLDFATFSVFADDDDLLLLPKLLLPQAVNTSVDANSAVISAKLFFFMMIPPLW
jgi:hypothetical protein